MTLKASRRRVVNLGIKYCYVQKCSPLDYSLELLEVFNEAQKSYYSANQNLNSLEQYTAYLSETVKNGLEFLIAFYNCWQSECSNYSDDAEGN